ncbi:MAG: hypothetical protein DWQ10_06520 [Calditrichaeota bacterium]|nr:MAG: hypothetical protein DWQ10_06520 [Calditrichota bacterium]
MARKNRTMLFLLVIFLIVTACGKDEEPDTDLMAEKAIEMQQPVQPDSAISVDEPVIQEELKEPLADSSPDPSEISAWFDKNGIYTLQLSSWKTRTYAQRDKKRFYEAGLDCRIEPFVPENSDRTWYRVRLGSFRTRKAAREFAEKYVQDLLEEPAWIDYK